MFVHWKVTKLDSLKTYLQPAYAIEVFFESGYLKHIQYNLGKTI